MRWLNGQAMDLAVALPVLWQALVGYRAGLVATAYGLAGRVLVLLVAWRLAPRLAAWPAVAPVVEAMVRWVQRRAVAWHLSPSPVAALPLAHWVVQILAFLLLAALLQGLLRRTVVAFSRTVNRLPVVGGLNRLAGAVGAAAVAAAAVAILLVLLGDAGVSWHWSAVLRAEHQSQAVQALLPVGHVLLGWLLHGVPYSHGLLTGPRSTAPVALPPLPQLSGRRTVAPL